MYVGSGENLCRRVHQLVEFSDAGPGRSVGHQGGRLLWQVEGSQEFLVAWRVTGPTRLRSTERDLIDEFCGAYGRLPFANLVKPASGP